MPMDAESRLALVRTKVERAKNNLRELEIDLRRDYDANPEWQDSTARTPAIGQDDYGRFHLPFDCLAAAGDVINNLRSALDHLVYQLVLAHDPEVDSGILERSGFPICENQQSYKKAKRKLKGIHPLAVEAIDKLKPYKDGNPQLWLLDELNNINKAPIAFDRWGNCHVSRNVDWRDQFFQ
jgi:hypothetical protein